MGETTTISAVTTAIVNMATSISNAGLDLIAQVLPVLAPIVAAIIIASLGYRLVHRFAG